MCTEYGYFFFLNDSPSSVMVACLTTPSLWLDCYWCWILRRGSQHLVCLISWEIPWRHGKWTTISTFLPFEFASKFQLYVQFRFLWGILKVSSATSHITQIPLPRVYTHLGSPWIWRTWRSVKITLSPWKTLKFADIFTVTVCLIKENKTFPRTFHSEKERSLMLDQ